MVSLIRSYFAVLKLVFRAFKIQQKSFQKFQKLLLFLLLYFC